MFQVRIKSRNTFGDPRIESFKASGAPVVVRRGRAGKAATLIDGCGWVEPGQRRDRSFGDIAVAIIRLLD
jgi:glycosyltransferase involved in cell wall biosynthesis